MRIDGVHAAQSSTECFVAKRLQRILHKKKKRIIYICSNFPDELLERVVVVFKSSIIKVSNNNIILCKSSFPANENNRRHDSLYLYLLVYSFVIYKIDKTDITLSPINNCAKKKLTCYGSTIDCS